MGIEQVTYADKVFALIIRRSFKKDGIEFFTPDNYSQQLGYMKRPKGYEIQPHLHCHVAREVKFTQEVLFIKSGKVKVNFYNMDKEFFTDKVLEAGDVILLADGGHGFEMLEESEMIEVKQGPYVGEADKERF